MSELKAVLVFSLIKLFLQGCIFRHYKQNLKYNLHKKVVNVMGYEIFTCNLYARNVSEQINI